MGRSVAKQLAAKGANIIIVSRNVGKLEEALADIKVIPHPTTHHTRLQPDSCDQSSAANPSTQRFQYISADLSEKDGALKVIADTIAWNNHQAPDIVWCIAGAACSKLFLETSTAEMRHQMDINFWSCADMAHAILSEWLSPDSKSKGTPRHLIFTSSVAGLYPVAGYAPYAPSKAAIKSLSDCLAQEVLLYGEDVKIHTVFPGTISSPGLVEENKTKPAITHILEESDPVQTPEEVARKAITGLENGEYLITVDGSGLQCWDARGEGRRGTIG